MKFIFATLIVYVVPFLALSQTKKELIGNWKVVKVEVADVSGDKEKQMLTVLEPIFMKSTFHFGDNNECLLKSPDKDLAFSNAAWKFDANTRIIVITDRKSTGAPGILMEIAVRMREGKYLFLMNESPLLLVMEKIL